MHLPAKVNSLYVQTFMANKKNPSDLLKLFYSIFGKICCFQKIKSHARKIPELIAVLMARSCVSNVSEAPCVRFDPVVIVMKVKNKSLFFRQNKRFSRVFKWTKLRLTLRKCIQYAIGNV